MSRDAGTSPAIRHLWNRARPRPLQRLTRLPFPLGAPTRPGTLEPHHDDRAGVYFDTQWARSRPAMLARRAITATLWRTLVVWYARPVVRGHDRLTGLDRKGGVLFASNHFSHADTTVLITTVPSPWRQRLFVAAAADYFFPNRVAGTLSALGIGAVPIERTRISKKSLELPIQLLKDGWSQVIYPEGGRSPDGWGLPFRPGVSLLSKAAEVPVVPVFVGGTERVLPRGANWPRRGRVSVTFGRPLRPDTNENHRDFAARLEAAVAALADESAHGWWAARRRAHEGLTPPLTGPDAPTWRRSWAAGERGQKRGSRTWPRP